MMHLLPGWTARDIPDLTGRRAVVTGANSGLGLHTALELARHGASVVATARSVDKGEALVDRIRRDAPDATVEWRVLDLADLSSVRTFADEIGSDPLDVLVNNAGVMAIPARRTVDGFEMQIGTNHLGPFALTGLLMPALLRRPGARVVSVSSTMHRMGTMVFDDLMSERPYQPWTAYAQSKLANLLFMRELDHRATAVGADLVSVAAHPGYTSTNLQQVGPHMSGSRWSSGVMHLANVAFGQRAAVGALPQLYAATAPDVQGGEFFGPRGVLEQRGLPTRVGMARAAGNDESARRLWVRSEELTGVSYLEPSARV